MILAAMTRRVIAGAMSGTSADGVDVAVVEISGRGVEMGPRVTGHAHRDYGPALRRRILGIRDGGAFDLRALAQCAREISLTYAGAVGAALRESGLSSSDLTAIAAHGQTLFHGPPNTIQWIDPALLAAELRCPVISDFRRADCAAGGQGAPLVPFADFILFRQASVPRVVLNLGGIANITYLPAGASLDQIIAFDTGPGNCILDHLMRLHDPAGPGIDVDGQIAWRGTVAADLLQRVLRLDYFNTPGPKSTDGPAMIAGYEDALRSISRPLSLKDQLATACQITGTTIANAIKSVAGDFTGELIVSGGGTKNPQVMAALRQHIAAERIKLSDELGIVSNAKEAIAFALLGAATLDGITSNVPSCTGAKRAVVLGSITPAPASP